MGFVIIRLQVQCSFRLEIGMLAIPQLKIGLGQLIMGCGKLAVDLNRVLKLYGGLAIFAIRKILLSTLKILLLSHIGIAVTGGEHQNERAHDQRRTKMRETFHGWSPGGIVLQVTNSAYARVAPKKQLELQESGRRRCARKGIPAVPPNEITAAWDSVSDCSLKLTTVYCHKAQG